MKKITFFTLFILTITLHGQNKLLSSISEYFDGSNWVNYYGSNYEYDTNNNLISETEFYWDNFESKWTNAYTSTYTYNGSDKAVYELYKNWNDVTNQFDDSYK